MAKGTAGKNYWALLLMILAGVVLGGFIGQLSAGVPALRWLNYGQTFGLSTPLVLDLGESSKEVPNSFSQQFLLP